MEDIRPRGRQKKPGVRLWKKTVKQLNKEDAIDHSKWRQLVRDTKIVSE